MFILCYRDLIDMLEEAEEPDEDDAERKKLSGRE
jgi:hypothetical protein